MAFALCAALLPSMASAQTFPGTEPGTDIGGSLPASYEPSGLTYNATTDKIWTVHDGGTVSRMDTDGTNVTNWTVSGDLEGITIADESSNFVYLGVEHADAIIEYNFATSTVVRTFTLTTWMTGPDNSGLEALTFVPIEGHAEGGLFYAGLQDTGEVFIFSLPIVSSAVSTTVTFVDSFQPVTGRTDISGLYYQSQGAVLWAVWDTANKIRAMDIDGNLIREFDLPGSAQEGVAVVSTDLFIAEDGTGEVFDYADFIPTDITISTTTRAGTSATLTGTAISGRAPLPVVIDVGSGTTTAHSTGSAEQIGIRWDEKKYTNLAYDHDTGGGAGVDPQITCTNCFSTLSWELNNANTMSATDWTASTADANEFFHDGGTELHGKPIGVRIAGSDATEGTCCALGASEWGWCNPSDCDAADVDANRLMVRLSDNSDPDSNATGTVQVLYGDGEYIELQHSTWNSGDPTYAYVKNKVSDDAITLAAAPSGADSDETDVIGYQAVNPWTDLRYEFSVVCPNGGGTCIEDITNGDQRPVIATDEIDETVGRGPIWAFVFKEGFGADATITIVAHDDANGDTTDSQTIDVDETDWTGSTDYYISSAGNDTTGDGSIGTPWLSWDKLVNELRTVTGGTHKRGFVNRGDTFTLTATVTNWSNESDDVSILPYGTGADPIIEVGSGQEAFSSTGSSANIRISEMNFQRTAGGATTLEMIADNVAIVGCIIEGQGNNTQPCMERGQGSIDVIVWDCYLEHITTGSTGSYTIYDSGGDVRHAVVGSYSKQNGNTMNMRNYNGRSLWAYNFFDAGGNDTGDAILEIAVAATDGDYYYVYANYLKMNASTGNCIFLFEDNVNVHDNIVVDSNFCNGTDSAASFPIGVEAEQVGTYWKITNNIFLDIKRSIYVDVGAPWMVSVFNNSLYSAKTGEQHFVMDDGGGAPSYSNVKVINNAVNMTVNNTSTNVVRNNGSFGTLESTQILNNVFSIGASAELASVESVLYAASANWEAASMKAAQINTAGDPLFALPASNDFRLCTLSGVPDASCTGTSPCIDAGYDLPTVYYDYMGTVRNSNDVGAIDDDQASAATGLCYECDGDCVDDQTEAECNLVGGEWEESGTCAGSATTGACCTAVEGNCTVITDYCCDDTWLTGDVCTDCTGQCCEADGTCSVVSQATCAAFTNEVFTWGGTCGTCPTVACCDGETCADLTAFACAALGFTSAGTGTDCGTGTPCADPSGSCCQKEGTCFEATESACGAFTGAVWLEAGTCSPNICAPAWACCVDEGCSDYTDAYCTTLTGDWYDGEACDVGFCRIGACCDVDTSCTETIELDCEGVADHWFGGDDCMSETCTTGTCCECDGTCTDAIGADCVATGAIFYANDTCGVEGCDTTVGACCYAGSCSEITDTCCTNFSGVYLGDSSTCAVDSCGPPAGSMLLLGVGK